MELRIVRFTTKFDAACHFYGELLGWPITHQWPADPDSGNGSGGRGCLFGYGDAARIEFIERGDEEPVNGIFVSVETTDVVGVHDRLAAAGVPILRSLADMTWGHRSFAVHDPTGIELVHFQPIP
jgi:catechol 2,3-dioxygenase-like lactoylglutathione lyase family enzyme